MNGFDAYRQQELLNAATEKALAKEYNTAQKNIRNYMAELYEKYGAEGSLTFNEMSKYNRMKQLDDFITQEIKDLTGRVNDEIKTLLKEQYEQSYFNYGSDISEQAGTELNWGTLNRDTIASIINEPAVSGKYLKDVLDKLRYETLLQERQVITQGLIQGDSFQDMAKRIKESMNKSYNDSIRIARTEGTRAAGEGQARAYDRAEELGVELERIWVAAGGSRTRPAHAFLNGKIADKEGYFHYAGKQARNPGGWGVAALDINCRCRVRAEVILPEE